MSKFNLYLERIQENRKYEKLEIYDENLKDNLKKGLNYLLISLLSIGSANFISDIVKTEKDSKIFTTMQEKHDDFFIKSGYFMSLDDDTKKNILGLALFSRGSMSHTLTEIIKEFLKEESKDTIYLNTFPKTFKHIEITDDVKEKINNLLKDLTINYNSEDFEKQEIYSHKDLISYLEKNKGPNYEKASKILKEEYNKDFLNQEMAKAKKETNNIELPRPRGRYINSEILNPPKRNFKNK